MKWSSKQSFVQEQVVLSDGWQWLILTKQDNVRVLPINGVKFVDILTQSGTFQKNSTTHTVRTSVQSRLSSTAKSSVF